MRKLIKKFFHWVFMEEVTEMERLTNQAQNAMKYVKDILGNMDISVDVHEYDHKYSPSWAVVSIQGKRTDYLKFMNLGQRDAMEIARILRAFEKAANVKIDATPQTSEFMRFESRTERNRKKY